MRAQREGHEINIARYNMYDSVWALALALNRTMTMVESLNISGTGCESMNGSLVPLHQFDYTNAMMGCLIKWNLQQTDFFGVSVKLISRMSSPGPPLTCQCCMLKGRRGPGTRCRRRVIKRGRSLPQSRFESRQWPSSIVQHIASLQD